MSFFAQFHKPGVTITPAPKSKIKIVKTSVIRTKTIVQNKEEAVLERDSKRKDSNSTNANSSKSRKVPTASRQSSIKSSPVNPKPRKVFRRAPVEQKLSSSDESSESESERTAKRHKQRSTGSSETEVGYQGEKRIMVNPRSFNNKSFEFIHAQQLANMETDKYTLFFPSHEVLPIEVSLQHPASPIPEKYVFVKPSDPQEFSPVHDIQRTVEAVGQYLLKDKSAEAVLDPEKGILRRLERFSTKMDQYQYMKVLREYNAMLRESRKDGTIQKNIQQMPILPLPLVELLLRQCFERTVSRESEKLKEYTAFSDNVYGELLFPLLNRMFIKTRLRPSSVFIDLGSGVGNAVLQAALQYGCESWGCEMMPTPARLAQLQADELKHRARLWGINIGKVTLESTSFFENTKIDEAIKRADVLLVNNFAFKPATNQQLVQKFLDLQDGTRIISLKPFVESGRVINNRNHHDILNSFRSEEFDFYSADVSWGAGGGKWYVTTVDRERLAKYHQQKDGLN